MIKQPKNNSQRYFIAFIIAVALLLMVNTLGWVPVADYGRDIVRPISSGLSSFGRRIGNGFSEVGRIGNLGDLNAQLTRENNQLNQENVRFRELEAENTSLRKQLKFPERTFGKMIGADVIGYQPDNVRQLIQINRGSNDGIRVGQIVVNEGNLVGKIQSVSAHASSVLLLNDINFRALVTDQKTQAPGISEGQIGGSVTMERIPQNQKVNSGDVIITSGLDGEFPRGLIVGRVTGVSHPGESIFNVAQIQTTFEPTRLKQVRIIVLSR